MLVSVNWIRDFVDLGNIDIKQLINRFSLSTAEVENIYEYGGDITDVVSALIISVNSHPSSDKLNILHVNDGTEIFQVVCGAPNVKEGMIVAFARQNAIIKGKKISGAVISGVESFGMCLSEKELGISDEHTGLMELDKDTPVGTSLKTLYPIEDVIFEIDNKSLTNRPDLWGHYGIAREIAVLTGRDLKSLEVAEPDKYNHLPDVNIKIHDTERCYRYMGIIINNITQKVSAAKMRIRLYYCGMRAINLLTDLTNYIMLELGQPMHAFDNTMVNDINVKTFENEFNFETLDGEIRRISNDTLMICDKNEPVAVAGIIGGKKTAISDNTNSVLLESANFNGVSVRKSSMGMGIRTEACVRYEKFLDPELTVIAVGRFLKLLYEADCSIQVASKLTDVYVKKYPLIQLEIEKAYIDKYTGIKIDNEFIINTLSALGFGVEFDNRIFKVIVPSWRATKDISIKVDLIEEITRIYGYDNFEIKTGNSLIAPIRHSDERENEYAAKLILSQKFSLNEVHSYIWYNAKANRELGIETKENIRIVNSISPDSNVLREYMAPTLLNIAQQNKNYFSETGIYEIGRVVKGLKNDGSCNEQKIMGILLGSRSLSEKDLFYRAKSIIGTLCKLLKNFKLSYTGIRTEEGLNWMHPYNSVSIMAEEKNIGYITVLHPKIKNNLDKKLNIIIAELNFNMLTDIKHVPVVYNEISRYPGIEVDLSLLVNRDMPYETFDAYLSDYSNDYLQKTELLNIYEDPAVPDKKSIAVRLYFGSMEKTLLKDEVEAYKREIIEMMGHKGIFIR